MDARENYTDNDRRLIELANNTPCTDWGRIDDYIQRADTEDAREELEGIKRLLFHREEYMAGCL